VAIYEQILKVWNIVLVSNCALAVIWESSLFNLKCLLAFFFLSILGLPSFARCLVQSDHKFCIYCYMVSIQFGSLMLCCWLLLVEMTNILFSDFV
jgi:hypothetical protein